MNVAWKVYSLLSRLVSGIKNALYDRGVWKPAAAPLPVISIGNITLGGTGKTPLVIEVMSWLASRGRRPALVSRGYRGRWEKKGGVVADGTRVTGGWRDGGDEPFMVARALPGAGVFVGRDRLASCRRARKIGFDTAVLDDGFQHRRLRRDLDIVLYSPGRSTAFRESASALRRADIVLVEKTEPAETGIPSLPAGLAAPLFAYEVVARGFHSLLDPKPVPAELLKSRPVLAFCGIARPERFSRLLAAQGLEPVSFISFPDHHSYPRSSVYRILRTARAAGAAAAVTTAKDAVKLTAWSADLADLPVYVLEIGLAADPGFYERLGAFLSRFPKD